MCEREYWWCRSGFVGRFDTCPSSSSSSDPDPDSSEDPGESDGGSTDESSEKSSRDVGSDGDVMMSGEAAVPGCSVEAVALFAALCAASNDRRVGKFGVDFDWKPAGNGKGFGASPRLCGGMFSAGDGHRALRNSFLSSLSCPRSG